MRENDMPPMDAKIAVETVLMLIVIFGGSVAFMATIIWIIFGFVVGWTRRDLKVATVTVILTATVIGSAWYGFEWWRAGLK